MRNVMRAAVQLLPKVDALCAALRGLDVGGDLKP
jgi:hypothetical protein